MNLFSFLLPHTRVPGAPHNSEALVRHSRIHSAPSLRLRLLQLSRWLQCSMSRAPVAPHHDDGATISFVLC